MSNSPLNVVSVGECTIDHYLDLQKRFVGGISLNFAVHCKKSGAEKVSLISCIGDDDSERILNLLKREDVGASHVQVVIGSTAVQNILLNANGERVFPAGGYHPGVLQGYKLKDQDLSFIEEHNVLASALFKQVESIFFQAIEAPGFHGWRVADFLDLSDYNKDISVVERICKRLNIAFVSGDEDMVERLRTLSRSTDCLIVVTCGERGSVALVKGEPIYQPAIQVDHALDSTGCGDAFQAAFTVSFWKDADVRKALQCGAQEAATVIQHYGAIQ